MKYNLILFLLFLTSCQSNETVSVVTTNNFPFCDYTSVEIFELEGKGEHTGASSVFDQRTGKSKVLNKEQVIDFLNLLNNKKSFGGSTASCHEPKLGVVFYNSDSLPSAYLSLCLDCNNIYTQPNLKHNLGPELMGFSLASRKKLHTIFRRWGFPDRQFSPLFDDQELFIDFLKSRGSTANEIKEALENFVPQNE